MRLYTTSLIVAATLVMLLCSGATATPKRQHQRQAVRKSPWLMEEEQKIEQELERRSVQLEEENDEAANETTTVAPPTTTAAPATTTAAPATTTAAPATTTAAPATTTAAPATTTAAPATTSPTTTPKPSLSGGAIAGIVIGSIAGVALIGGGVYYLYMKKKFCFSD